MPANVVIVAIVDAWSGGRETDSGLRSGRSDQALGPAAPLADAAQDGLKALVVVVEKARERTAGLDEHCFPASPCPYAR